MAFSLSAFEAMPVELGGAQVRRAIQRVVFHVAGTASDVDLDLGDFSGTFWSAADGTDLGAAVLAEIQKIVAQVSYRTGVYCPEIDALTRAPAEEVDYLDSAASTGGNANETLTVTGLLTTDKILGVTIQTMGANSVTIEDYESAAGTAGQLDVTFSGDPGAGAVVRVAIEREGAATVDSGEYTLSFQNNLPNYTLPTGEGLTSYKVVVDFHLLPNILPVALNYGIGG